MGLLVDISHLQENHLKNLDMRANLQEAVMKELINHNPTDMVSANMAIEKQIDKTVRKVTSAISHAQIHRLAPGVYDLEALQSVVDHVKAVAEKHQYSNFVNHVSDLYQLETSYVFNPQTLVFSTILHIPMVKKENLLNLYR